MIITSLSAISQSDTTDIATPEPTDTIPAGSEVVQTTDSAYTNADSLAISAENDSLPSRDVVNSRVDFKAADSAAFDVANNRYLMYRNAVINYEDLELKAAFIEYNFETNTVCAEGRIDSAGNLVDTPVFIQAGKEYKPKSMCYNFRTGRAFIKETITQQGEFFLHAKSTKRQPTGWFSIKNGKITTCNAENPHYHFQLSRAVVIPNDKIVSGPVYMKIRKVPTPLALPFGFFPRKNTSTHGILLPAYGDANQLGFFLRDLGYYIPIGNWADTKILGDIYSRGSWSLRNVTGYRKRYKYTGAFNISRTVQKTGIEGLDDFRKTVTFFVKWRHGQDPKAHPKSNFSADVNLGSQNNFTNNLNSSQQDYLTNTFQSNIRYSRSGSINGTPTNLNVNLRHSQNSQTGIMDLNLPTVAFMVTRFFPFENLDKGPGTSQLMEEIAKIGINYSANFDNRLSIDQSDLTLNNLDNVMNDFRNGVSHNASATTSLKAWYFTINPNFNYNEYWYFRYLQLGEDPESMAQQLDTVSGFIAGRDWNLGVSANTKVYTTIQYKSQVVRALRHVLTPSVGFSYRPNRDTRQYAYLGEEGDLTTFSPFDLGIYSVPNPNRNGFINFALQNNLEMKVRDRSNTKSGTKKLKLIENFTVSSAYDMFRDSLNWSSISMNGFTTLFQNISLNYRASYNPYARDSSGTAIDQFLINERNQLMRLENVSAGISARLRSKIPQTIGQTNTGSVPVDELEQQDSEVESTNQKFRIPWTLNLTYSLGVRRIFDESIQQDTSAISQSILFNGDFTVFEKWKIGFYSGYDFTANDWTPTTLSLYWDLHCWEMSFNWVPFGFRQNYSIQLNVKASALQDLKLQRKRNLSAQDDLLL